MTSAPIRIVILGGGFGGVTVAQQLEKLLPGLSRPVEVTLISQSNYLLFVPMLPSAAAAGVELTHILSPLRELLKQTRIRVETVESVDLAAKTVTTTHPTSHREQILPWDHLVVALGNVVDLARLPGVAQHGLPIKTIGDALQIRNRALEMLEAAENTDDPDERRRMLTFVVAGGGYSGVEMAAELNDYLREVERKSYPVIQANDVRVILLHSGKRILPEISESLAQFAHKKLTERGVEVQLGARLASATAEQVTLEGGEKIDAHTLIVAIGSSPNPVVQGLRLPMERGRLKVDTTMRAADGLPVWALGDCAAVPHPTKSGESSPPTAQFALRQGKTLAQNVVATIQGKRPKRFAFKGLGEMVSLGNGAAVAELLGRVKLAGPLAWIMWRTFYLMRLPTMERRVRVWLDWNLDRLFSRDLVQLRVQRSERVTHAHYEPGQPIIRQGDLADAFYVIVKGSVEVVREEDGEETVLARLTDGDSFGELGLLQHRRRTATVRAVDPVDVIVLGRSDFDLLAGTWKHLGQSLDDIARARSNPRDALGADAPDDIITP
ncbi:MAG: FAD-dependent oxidoreductase [Chloroflexi bacterium]|nr:FAD-dependent oxidoreductase [Chloroflexota bacterium]